MSNKDSTTVTPSDIPEENQKIQSIIDKSIQSAMQTAMHDSIAQSVVMALSQSKPQVTPEPLPITPSDIYWSAEDSTSHMIQGLKKAGKVSQKRHHISHTGPSHSKRMVLMENQGESSKPPSKGKATVSDKRSHVIPSAREELILQRVKMASKRQKPDSYRTSSSNSSSDEESLSEEGRDSEYENVSDAEEGIPLKRRNPRMLL